MKIFLAISLLLVFFSCESNSSSRIIGTPNRIGEIEVAERSFPKPMTWQEAKAACAELGTGWRLPTRDELNVIWKNKDKIGGFHEESGDFYCSSSIDESNWVIKDLSPYVWGRFFNVDFEYKYPGSPGNLFYVRAVRFLPSEKIAITKIENRIRDIEVAERSFPKSMTWEEAKAACTELGNGWRLPTRDELNEMWKNKDEIGNFVKGGYWCSTEYNIISAWGQDFNDGFQYGNFKTHTLYVHAVRSF